jgi:phage FluMu gp28-like protein
VVAAQGQNGPLCGKRALIISKDDESSKEVLRECANWVRVLQGFGIVGFDGDPTAGRIRLTNGVHIISMPGGRPEAFRGPNGSVWFDEFEYHRDQEENYYSATGVTTRGGLIRMLGTPGRDSSLFWDIRLNRDNKYPTWSRHLPTIHDALKVGIIKPDGTPLTLEELHIKMPLLERFACEYECKPLSDVLAYFGKDLLDDCTDKFKLDGGSLYGGYDVAVSEKGDLSAIVEIRRDGDKYECTRVVMAERGMDDGAQEDIAYRTFKDYGWERMNVDCGGVGHGVANRLRKRLTSARCEGVTFSLREKSDMMTNLHELMEQGRLSLPADRELWLDLYSIKREFTDSGQQKFSADVTKRGHADRAMALALAVRAAGTARPRSKHDPTAIRRRKPAERMY